MSGGGVGKREMLWVKSVVRSVADMMMIRSGVIVFAIVVEEDAGVIGESFDSRHFFSRSLDTLDKTPMRTSVFTPLSCASSTTTTLYLLSKKSADNSRRSTPSVINLIAVSEDVVEEYRI